MSKEVHIAGAPLQIKTRVRQRCAWCGTPLHDKDLDGTSAEVDEYGNAEPFMFWPMGAMIAIVKDTSWQVPFDPETDAIPSDCCAALDPEVTA